MHNPVMTHQGQGSQHLTSESPDESCRESDKAVCLDELVEVDAQQLHGDAQVTAEIEVLSHLDHMVLLFRILGCIILKISFKIRNPFRIRRTHFRRLSRILISTSA